MFNRCNFTYFRYFNTKFFKRIYYDSRFISNGDDYQISFTASVDRSRIILDTSKKLGIKISKIGKIISNNHQSVVIDQKGKQLKLKNKGYRHQF